MAYEIHLAFPAHDRLGEGPVWNASEAALYWVDIPAGRFHLWEPGTGVHVVHEVGTELGVLRFRAGSGLILGTRRGLAFWDGPDAELRVVSPPECTPLGVRFNDGAVDRRGRFWAGTMGRGPVGVLYRLDPNGSIHTMETGLSTSNGLGWSPDNRTMYLTDSPLRVIWAYDFDLETGSIANRRPFVESTDESGVPDGLTVDAEGCVWSARWEGRRLTRYDPDGKEMLILPMPVSHPTACTFAGPTLEDLYITSASLTLDKAGQRAQPHAGSVLVCRPGVRGLPEPLFAG
jgi:sugar lactone lactonase YvrE